MNETYNLSWNLKRRSTAVLFNKKLSFPSSIEPLPKKTYTLPISYADVDNITFEVQAIWTSTSTDTKYAALPNIYGLNAHFTSKSIEIPGNKPGSAKETSIAYAISQNPEMYSAVNPWAHSFLPLDPSLPWKEVTYSAVGKKVSGSFKATINNPFKNNTKDTYLHGSMMLYADEEGSNTTDNLGPIDYDIDDNILTIKAGKHLYSLSLTIKITAQYTVNI